MKYIRLVLLLFTLPFLDVVRKWNLFGSTIENTDVYLTLLGYLIIILSFFYFLNRFLQSELKSLLSILIIEILFFNYYSSIDVIFRIGIFFCGISLIYYILKIAKDNFLNTFQNFFIIYLFLYSSIAFVNISFSNKSKLLEGPNIWDKKSQVLKLQPDIYFVVFDQMTSLKVANTEFGINTSNFEKYLKNQGFVLPESYSNYLQTAQSITSTLTGSLLKQGGNIENKDIQFEKCTYFLKDSLQFGILTNQSYTLNNFSIFKINGTKNQSEVTINEYFNILGNPLFINTLFSIRFKKVLAKYFGFFEERETSFINSLINNENEVFNFLKQTKKGPEFNYFHFFTTHDPFYTVTNGNKIQIHKTDNLEEYHKSYKVGYEESMSKIVKLLNLIDKRGGEKIIIIIGDHGYRLFDSSKEVLKHVPFVAIKTLSPEDNLKLPSKINLNEIFKLIISLYY